MLPVALIALAALGVSAHDPIHVPIARRTHGGHTVDRLPRMADFVRSRYNHPTLRKRAGTTTALAITNQVRALHSSRRHR